MQKVAEDKLNPCDILHGRWSMSMTSSKSYSCSRVVYTPSTRSSQEQLYLVPLEATMKPLLRKDCAWLLSHIYACNQAKEGQENLMILHSTRAAFAQLPWLFFFSFETEQTLERLLPQCLFERMWYSGLPKGDTNQHLWVLCSSTGLDQPR